MRTGIFGAGQGGMMILKWLPADNEAVCFIDNNINKQNTVVGNVPVVSLDDAMAMNLDEIMIAVLNRDAEKEIRNTLVTRQFPGIIKSVNDFRLHQDIRLSLLRLVSEIIYERQVSGAAAELGVYQGEFAREINRCFPDRKLYLFDTFEGFDSRDTEIETTISGQSRFRDFSDTSELRVMEKMPIPENVRLIKGYFPDSLVQMEEERFAFVSLDPDLYQPAKSGLEYFYPRLNVGGIILIHDYTSIQFPGVRQAVDDFCLNNKVFVIPLMDLHGSAVLLKQGC